MSAFEDRTTKLLGTCDKREVEAILVSRTVQYLHSIGYSVSDALSFGWLLPKFKTKALKYESEYYPLSLAGALKLWFGR